MYMDHICAFRKPLSVMTPTSSPSAARRTPATSPGLPSPPPAPTPPQPRPHGHAVVNAVLERVRVETGAGDQEHFIYAGSELGRFRCERI